MPASAKPSLWLSLVLIGTLLLGVVGGMYLVTHPQVFKSKASENGAVIILDGSGQQLENNTTTTPNIKLNIELPDWNSNPSQSFNFSLVKEAKAYHGSCLDTYNDCIYWEGYICDDNTHSCILQSQPLPAINNICEYEESAGLEVCQYGGRRICKGTNEGEGCHYNENVVPACRDICKCQYEEDVQSCSYGGRRVCWGEEEVSRSKSCGYSYAVEPGCVETCKDIPISDTVSDIPKVTERVRISLDSSSVQLNGNCQNSSDPFFNGNPSSHCLELTYPELLSRLNNGGLDWSFGSPGVYTLYAGFISNQGDFRQTSQTVTYQPIQATALTPQITYECGCMVGENICNSGCSSNGTVGNYCTEDSSCTTRVEASLPFARPGGQDPQQLFRDSGVSLEDYQKILIDLQAVYGDKVIGWVWQDLGLGEKRPTPIYSDTQGSFKSPVTDLSGLGNTALDLVTNGASTFVAENVEFGRKEGEFQATLAELYGKAGLTVRTGTSYKDQLDGIISNYVDELFANGSITNPGSYKDNPLFARLTFSRDFRVKAQQIETLKRDIREYPDSVLTEEEGVNRTGYAELLSLSHNLALERDQANGTFVILFTLGIASGPILDQATFATAHILKEAGVGLLEKTGITKLAGEALEKTGILTAKEVVTTLAPGIRKSVEIAEREFTSAGKNFNNTVDSYILSFAQPIERQAAEAVVAQGLDQAGSISRILEGKNSLEDLIRVVDELGYIPQEGTIVNSEVARRQIQEAIAFGDFKVIGNSELRQSVIVTAILEEEKSLLLAQTPRELIEKLRDRYKLINADGESSLLKILEILPSNSLSCGINLPSGLIR